MRGRTRPRGRCFGSNLVPPSRTGYSRTHAHALTHSRLTSSPTCSEVTSWPHGTEPNSTAPPCRCRQIRARDNVSPPPAHPPAGRLRYACSYSSARVGRLARRDEPRRRDTGSGGGGQARVGSRGSAAHSCARRPQRSTLATCTDAPGDRPRYDMGDPALRISLASWDLSISRASGDRGDRGDSPQKLTGDSPLTYPLGTGPRLGARRPSGGRGQKSRTWPSVPPGRNVTTWRVRHRVPLSNAGHSSTGASASLVRLLRLQRPHPHPQRRASYAHGRRTPHIAHVR